ncbi:hypothetical protein LAZ67_8003811 [Cordylochernes scorpioides]|uniref:Uncharacterized protein n=1 Tax=Cordylochernes scorpioides TaxID=51811 RepID=A0ABY6KRV5_9ARAC|nr:hypothetical protein LAZ67_8003811 [Cordylochernes scorpioides]
MTVLPGSFYWACYSTGLGALLHELGHTLDLGHTATGIMCRGDNIYLAFLPAPNPTDLQMGTNASYVCGTEDLETDDQPHWARSSSVMLHFHKWLNPEKDELTSTLSAPYLKGNRLICPQGLGVVEFRNQQGLCLSHQEFLKYPLPTELKLKANPAVRCLVALDSKGNLLKTSLDLT